jgi:hypothetical protein
MLNFKNIIVVLFTLFVVSASAQVSTSGCYISGALIDPGSTAGCGNTGTNNYCNLASLFVPAYSPVACGTATTSGGVNHTKATVFTLPAGCTATVDAEFKKRNYLGVGASATGCGNAGMDAGSPDALYIIQSGGIVVSQSSTIDVNVTTCGAYPSLGVYTTATASLSAGCGNADGSVEMILTGGTFTIGGASNRADEIITFTVSMSGSCGPSCSAVLPIELISFFGEPRTDKVDLFWKVATEHHVDHYRIEKSSDGLNWKILTNIPASNKTYGSNLTYKTSDNYPVKGVNYYKLTNVDADDSQGLSAMVAVNYTGSETTFWVEQTNDELIIHLKNDQSEGFDLLDNSGRTILDLNGTQGSDRIEISKNGLAKGAFILRSKTNKRTAFTKLIVY